MNLYNKGMGTLRTVKNRKQVIGITFWYSPYTLIYSQLWISNKLQKCVILIQNLSILYIYLHIHSETQFCLLMTAYTKYLFLDT